jgi:acetylornithine deacetylase/succinyl-diaminopimelate desuccinylase-like protein
MLNGHMDTIEIVSGWTVDPYGATFEDGWIWGAGAHDDKGGLAAALCAVEAILASGTRLKGDVLLCPVACHKGGGVGTRTLLENGVRADMCINMEHSANTIATSCVGRVQIRIATRNKGLFFRYSAEAKAAYYNAIEQQAEIIRRLGPSIEPATPEGWLTFTRDPDLPGFPMHLYSAIHKDSYPRECELLLEVRTVPGQTVAQIESDLTGLLEAIKTENANLDYALAIPAGGPEDVTCEAPMWISKDHPLVLALAEGHRRAARREPVLGGGLRVGNVGDGNILCEAGIPSVQYGPGDIRLYPEWPGPDERVELREVVEASRAIACAIWRICG